VSPRAWTLFAAVSVLWGMPYLFIKIAVDEGVSPAVVAFVRVVLAALVLLPFALRTGALRGLRARWRPLVAFAVLEIVLPFPLIAYGEQHVASSLAAILIAALPLTIAVLALRFDAEERVGGARLAGLLVGLAGVVLLLGIDVAGDGQELLGALAILLATVGYAGGPLVIKRHLADTDPRGSITAAMVVSAVLLAPAAALTAPATTPSADAIGALAVLGVVCTAAAFVLYFTLIADVGPSRAAVITYVNPVVAVALGVTFLGESVTAGAVAGLLLILAGSYLATGGGGPPAVVGRALAWSAKRTSRRPSTPSARPGSSPLATRAATPT
jgi:drug/metabolite transporter (DMT)-like permease